jgi:hypothetical protein
MSAETVQGRNEVGNSRQHFATLRPEAPNTFTGNPVELEDWLEAVHMIEYNMDPLEEYRAWNSLNKLQQIGSVKDYSEMFLQLIVKVGNNASEKDKLRRYVEGLKDKVRTVIRVGMVDGRYTIFSQVKSAAEALDFELWRSRRKTNTAGSSTTWQATKPTTGASASGAANHHKTVRYPVPVNAMRNLHKLSKEDTARYLSEFFCFGCDKSGHMARACPDKRKYKREAPEEN